MRKLETLNQSSRRIKFAPLKNAWKEMNVRKTTPLSSNRRAESAFAECCRRSFTRTQRKRKKGPDFSLGLIPNFRLNVVQYAPNMSCKTAFFIAPVDQPRHVANMKLYDPILASDDILCMQLCLHRISVVSYGGWFVPVIKRKRHQECRFSGLWLAEFALM